MRWLKETLPIMIVFGWYPLISFDNLSLSQLNVKGINKKKKWDRIYQGKEGTLLISKHENSISYNNNIQYIIDQHKDYSILLIIDDISRKYFTADTSWLWDINFELLNNKNLKQLVVAGKYTDDRYYNAWDPSEVQHAAGRGGEYRRPEKGSASAVHYRRRSER